MMLRVQGERMQAAYFPSTLEYSRLYGLDAHRMSRLPEHARGKACICPACAQAETP